MTPSNNIEAEIDGLATELQLNTAQTYWLKNSVNTLVSQATVQARIDPYSYVEPCEPDCTPERHAYHQGQWDLAGKIEAALQSQSKGGEKE